MACCTLSQNRTYDIQTTAGFRSTFSSVCREVTSSVDAAGWLPIMVDASRKPLEFSYTQNLSSPRITGFTLFDPTNCQDSDFTDRSSSDPNFTNLNTSYCEDWFPELNGDISQRQLFANAGKRGKAGQGGCGGGLCDVTTHQGDLNHGIPYLLTQYAEDILDNKFTGKFPLTQGQGAGFQNVATSESSDGNQRYTDWLILPRMGEVDYNPSNSQYLNERDHGLALKKAQIAHKTAGNFILFNIGDPSLDKEDWELKYSGYSGIMDNIVGEEEIKTGGYWKLELPEPEVFTTPHGFDGYTYNNVFIQKKKRLSYWKWDIKECPIAWVLNSDQPNNSDLPYQTYVPSGDCFIAEIEPVEPENFCDSNQINRRGEKRCPSGVKFMESGSVYTIPHGSLAVYVSCNLYPKFYQAFNELKKSISEVEYAGESPPNEVYSLVKQAMFVATHPLVDKITVDLHKTSSMTTEPQIPWEYGGYLQPQYSDMNAFDKKYASFGNLYLCSTWDDIAKTISDKYGSYYSPQAPIYFSQVNTSQAHIGFDFLYDWTSKPEVLNSYSNNASDDYRGFIPWYPNFSISYNNIKIIQNSDGRNIIPRHTVVCETEQGVANCDLSGPVAFSNLRFENGQGVAGTLYSEYLQSGMYDLSSYYARSVNISQNSARSFCDECDQYSSYSNYGGSSDCSSLKLCDCLNNETDEEGNPDPCYAISDNTLRLSRYYKILVDNNSFPLTVAMNNQGGVYYRSKNLEKVGFGGTNFSSNSASLSVSFDSFSISRNFNRPKIYVLDAYRIQTDHPSTFRCEAFPTLEDCEPKKLIWDSTYPIRSDGGKQFFESNSTSPYVSQVSVEKTPCRTMKSYGGYNDTVLTELFPDAGLISERIVTGSASRIVRRDSDNPFGCTSSSSISHENYVNNTIKVNIKNIEDVEDSSNRASDIFMSTSETVKFTKPRYTIVFEPWGDEYIVNKDMKRFATSTTIVSQADENVGVPSLGSQDTVWPGGNRHLIGIDKLGQGSFYLQFHNPFLVNMMVLAGVTPENEMGYGLNVYPDVENDDASYDDYLGIPRTWCNRREMWYDFGDQTSRVLVTFTKRPRPTLAKLALSSPKKVLLGKGAKFIKNELVVADAKKVYPSNFRNQNNPDIIPRYTFNNAIQTDTETQPESASYLITGDYAKSFAPLFVNTHGFRENRKIKIILRTDEGKHYEILTKPTRYFSHGKSYEGYPHFVKVVPNGNQNNYLPGMVPFIQRTDSSYSSKWEIRPNTKYAFDKAGMGNDGALFDYAWPLNLNLNNYEIDVDQRKIVLPGARLFFTLFPETTVINDDDRNAPVGSFVTFSGDDTQIYYKLRSPSDVNEEKFQDSYTPINPFDSYTWQKYSDLHMDFANTSFLGYVYNSAIELPNIPFYFYREPYGDRTKTAKTLAYQARLVTTLVGSDGRRIFPGSLIDGCVDYCQDASVTFLKVETEVFFKNNLNKQWKEINQEKTPLASYHLIHQQCVGAEKDRLLVNDKYTSKWSDLLEYDGITFDHSLDPQVAPTYYPGTVYDNVFYKTIVDNGNYITTNKNSILPEAGPFRFMVHQKYSVDYEGNEPVAARRISGVHNYFPFMDINDKSSVQSANYLITEPLPPVEDGEHIWPKQVEDGVFRPDLEFIVTIPADCTAREIYMPHGRIENVVLSDSVRVDTPLYYLSNILKDDQKQSFDVQDIRPSPKTGRNYGRPANPPQKQNVWDAATVYPVSFADDPVQLNNRDTWTPDPFARFTYYSDLDPEECYRESERDKREPDVGQCRLRTAGALNLEGEYKLAVVDEVPFSTIAKKVSTISLTYNAGMFNGLNSVAPPRIVRSMAKPKSSINSSNDILYSKEYPDQCLDKNVLPPLYQYPEWDREINDTFMAGVKDIQNLADTNSADGSRAKEVLTVDRLAEEMLFRSIYGETDYTNRQSVDGKKKLSVDQILNFVDPEINVKTLWDQVLWGYDGNPLRNSIQTFSFAVNAPKRIGEQVSLDNGGITARIVPSNSSEYTGADMELNWYGEVYRWPISLTSVKFNNYVSVEAGGEEPEVGEDSSIEIVQAGRVFQPGLTYEVVRCGMLHQSETFIPPEGTITEEPGETSVTYGAAESVNMGSIRHMLLALTKPYALGWYDEPYNCQTEPDMFGPYTRRCYPFTYGYCSNDVTLCPPCRDQSNAYEAYDQLVGASDKDYYVRINEWNNNYDNTDNQLFDYNWRYCRTNFQSRGYIYRENFTFAPENIKRSDLEYEYGEAEYQLAYLDGQCRGECGGQGCECYCAERFGRWYPNILNWDGETYAGWGWCDYNRITCPENPNSKPDPNYPECYGCGCVPEDENGSPSYTGFAGGTSNCWCRGGPGGSDGPEGCEPYGYSPCYQRYCFPATKPNGGACLEGKNLASGGPYAQSTYYTTFGFDPGCCVPGECDGVDNPPVCGTPFSYVRCNPKGYCLSAHDAYTGEAIQWQDLDPTCNPTHPYMTYTSTYYSSFYSSYGRYVAGNWVSANDGAVYFGRSSNDRYSYGDAIDIRFMETHRRNPIAYDTYMITNNYNSNSICSAGQDLRSNQPSQWFSISMNADSSLTLSASSGVIRWSESREFTGGGEFPCVGPRLGGDGFTLCTDNASRNMKKGEFSVSLPEIGYLSAVNQDSDCDCEPPIKVSIPTQTPVWATRVLEGKCYVSDWFEQHITSSLPVFNGNATAVCQTSEVVSMPAFGTLVGYNMDDCYNNNGGSSCPSDISYHGLCDGWLERTDCYDADSCATGKASWQAEQEYIQYDRITRYGNANAHIPAENILEGMIPGTLGPLKFKTYSVPGGQKVHPKQSVNGAEQEEMGIYVTIAYYEYKYKARWNIQDTITQSRGETGFVPAPGAGPESEDAFQGCYRGRPFGPTDVSNEMTPREAYWTGLGPDLFKPAYAYGWYRLYPEGGWLWKQSALNYYCAADQRAYPNWYNLQVAPHGCFPRYDGYYLRYLTPPRNFLWTVPTISQSPCENNRSCYYNDKQWPANKDDPFALTSQGTFLHCQKHLGKNWTYDYYRDSPFG